MTELAHSELGLVKTPALNLPKDHHRLFMASLSGAEALALHKRFTLDFHADPDLEKISEDEARFLYERGFLPEKIRLYGLNPDNVDCYLSDVQRWMTRLVNGPYSVVFNNKVLFTQVFGRYACVPDVVAISRNGRMIPYSSTWNQVVNGKADGKMLVAKPLGGGGGGSIFFIRISDKYAVVETNDATAGRLVVRLNELGKLLAEQQVPFIINSYVQQGKFTHDLFPLTVNTIRILVVRNKNSGQPYVVRAVLRVGNSFSYPIDNFSLGGLSIEIDMENGVLGSAIAAEGKFSEMELSCHPDTGEIISGKAIPNWGKVKQDICAMFDRLPYLKYCGFDLILLDDGFVVLEGNSYSQVRLFQMHSPLLSDSTYVEFLKDYGLCASEETI